jgi:hypothetical protein
MPKGVLTHSGGAYDGTAQQDVIDGAPFTGPITYLTGATDAINPHKSGNYIITYDGGVDAMTIKAPISGVEDGLCIAIYSGTAHAHTLTSVSLFSVGTSAVSVLTFGAYAGAGLVLRAYAGLWQMVQSTSMTLSS